MAECQRAAELVLHFLSVLNLQSVFFFVNVNGHLWISLLFSFSLTFDCGNVVALLLYKLTVHFLFGDRSTAGKVFSFF